MLLHGVKHSTVRCLQLPLMLNVSAKLQTEMADLMDILQSSWFDIVLSLLAMGESHRVVCSSNLQAVLRCKGLARKAALSFSPFVKETSILGGLETSREDEDYSETSSSSSSSEASSSSSDDDGDDGLYVEEDGDDEDDDEW